MIANEFAVKNKQGFTLVEMMIVIAIIGILIAMAIPSFESVRIKAKQAEAIQNLRLINSLILSYADQYDGHPASVMDAWSDTGPAGADVTGYYALTYYASLDINCDDGPAGDACNCKNAYGFRVSNCEKMRYSYVMRVRPGTNNHVIFASSTPKIICQIGGTDRWQHGNTSPICNYYSAVVNGCELGGVFNANCPVGVP